MPSIGAAHKFKQEVMEVRDESRLSDLLAGVCNRLGCTWFALSHHVDFLGAPGRGIRLHNYPPDWAQWFDDRRLGISDPVHRESQRRLSGFVWSEIPPHRISRPQDKDIFRRARRYGIGDGLTVPAHLPGEAHGSVSFAWLPGQAPHPEALHFVEMISGSAFDAARLIAHPELAGTGPRLTQRQRECLILSATGKSSWDISQIKGLSEDTVKEHLRNARARYQVHGRTPLTVRALFEGEICFGDLAGL